MVDRTEREQHERTAGQPVEIIGQAASRQHVETGGRQPMVRLFQGEGEQSRDPRLTAGSCIYPMGSRAPKQQGTWTEALMTAVREPDMSATSTSTPLERMADIVSRVQEATIKWSETAVAATAAVQTEADNLLNILVEIHINCHSIPSNSFYCSRSAFQGGLSPRPSRWPDRGVFSTCRQDFYLFK